MKKRFVAMLMAMLMVFSMLPTMASAEGDKLIIWTAITTMQEIMDNYFAKAYPDVEYEVVLYSGGDYTQKLDAVLAANTDDRPDIITAEVSYGKRYVKMDGATTSLYDLGITEEELSELTPAVVDFMRDENGAPMGVSWQVTPGGLFYRRSVAEKWFGVSEPEDFQALVKDWDTFIATAKTLKEKSNGDVKMIATVDDFQNPFLNGARSQGWVVDGKLVLDDAIYDMMEMSKLFYQEGYTHEFTHWSTGWYQSLTEDNTLCYMLPTWGMNYQLIPNCTTADGKTSMGDWGLVEAPSPYTWGGTWLLATGKNAEKYDDIAKVIRYVGSAEFQEAYATNVGDFVSNMDVQAKVAETCTSDFLGGQNHYKVFTSVATAVNPAIQSEYDGYIRGYFVNAAVYPYMRGEVELDEAIAAFKEEVDLYYDGAIIVE